MPPSMEAPSKEFLDLDTATVLKEPRDLTRHILDQSAKQAYLGGQLAVPSGDPQRSHLARIEGTNPESLGQALNISPVPDAIPVPAAAPLGQVPGVAIPSAVPAALPAPVVGAPAIVTNQPAPAASPAQPGDSARVQTRINRLFGQMKTAQEERNVYADRIADLESQLVQARTPQREYSSLESAPASAGSPSAGDYVSRNELNQMFGELTQAIGSRDKLSTSQNASRAGVERDFAQDLLDATFRQTYETVFAQDEFLGADPNGPEKAAVMARGLLAAEASLQPSPTADVARRQAMSPGVGASISEGGAAPVPDQVTRYNQAIDLASRTGRNEDFVQALLIQRGQA